MSASRRKHQRVSIRVPIHGTLLDSRGKIESDFVGVALDVSLGGLRIESPDLISNEYIGISFIDTDNQVADIKGKMAYSQKTDSGLAHTGLSFQGAEKEKLDFVVRIMRTYYYRDRSVLPDDNAPMKQDAVGS